MEKIKLTKGQYALVDDEDYKELCKHKWYANWHPHTRSFYAVRGDYASKKYIKMHRQIMTPPDGLVVDHINHDTLDNRKDNLRICTLQQNAMNRKINSKNSTGYAGVTIVNRKYKDKIYTYFLAQISIKGKHLHIGLYSTAKLASDAYQSKAKELFGEYKLTIK